MTTDHFALSVTSQVLGQATDISSVIKYFKNNMNYQNFVFENELDTANRLLLQAISENDIKKSASVYSKSASEQVKNFSTLTKLATVLEDTSKATEGAEALDTYKTMLNETFGFLETVAPRLKSKLPEINDSLAKQLGDGLESVSKLADAMELAAAVAVTVMAQEAQLELVYQILNDAPTDSTLYKGMTRLKGQLEGGAVTFFTETFLNDAVFKKIIDKFTDGIIKSIGGKVPGLNVIPIILAVVDVVNTVVFKWIMGADYDTYISAVLLTDYKQGLADTLDNMSDRYASYFSSDDIIAYDNVFNTYITVNYEVYKLYCKLSTHNTEYNSAYTESMSGIYEDMSYEKYIAEVRAYILDIPEEIREKTEHGTWNLAGDTILKEPTDEIALGYCYMPKSFKGNITLSNGSLTIEAGNSFTVDGSLYLNSGNVTLNNDGAFTVTDTVIMGDQGTCCIYNNGNMTVGSLTMKSRYAGNYVYYKQHFYNNSELIVIGDILMEGSEPSYFYMNEDDSVLRIGGDILGYNANSFPSPKGDIILCGTQQQSVKYLSVNNLTVTNKAGIKYLSDIGIKGRYDLCGNTLDRNGFTTKLEGNASLAPGSDYGDVHVNCDLTIEGYLAGRLSVTTNNKSIRVAEGTEAVFDGLIYLHNSSSLINDGTLTVTDHIQMGDQGTTYVYNNGNMTVGSLTMKSRYAGYYVYYKQYFYNNGDLTVTGDILMEGSEPSYFYMNEDDSVLRIGGDILGYNASSFPNKKGKIILDGTAKQTVVNLTNANIVEIENESYEGVSFNSTLNYTTLFDHKGNRFTAGSMSNVDYDGDGMQDRYDPKPTVGEKASVITRDYDVMIGHAGEIKHIRYASGIHESVSTIKIATDRVDIDASVVAANTENNVYTRNMPDGGVYTFHIKLNDGTELLRTVDMSNMKQRVTVDGVRITTHNLYGVKDYFIAEGDFDSYNEIKDNGYIVRLTESKLGSKHDYTYTVSNPGRHTVLVRYKDTSRPDEVFKVDLVVDEPTFSVNGLQVTIGNIPGVKVIRTAYGEYNTPGEVKKAAGARNFSNKSVIKDASEYKIQYREEGRITIVVEYDNGYVKVFHHDLVKKKPTVEQDGNTVTFGDLDGLVMIRYAKGEYKTSSEIKKATGSKAIKPEAIADGKISVTLDPETYTFCVQYDDESYNYYTIMVE